MNITSWLIVHSTALLALRIGLFQGFMAYNYYSGLISSLHHVKMQINDVIKNIGWYWAFVALLIQTNIAKKSTDTDSGIGIGASLIIINHKQIKINTYYGI